MKVIEVGKDTKEKWTKQIVCNECKSKLKINVNDIQITKRHYYYDEIEHFYCKCPCGCEIDLDSKLPASIERAIISNK